MPVGITNTVQLSEDVAGNLRADLRLDPSSRNMLAVAPGAPTGLNTSGLGWLPINPNVPSAAYPGVYGFQAEPAIAMAYSVPFGNNLANAPNGLLLIQAPNVGAAATFLTVPFQSELFDQDGLGDITAEIVDATNGIFTTVTPGYWRAGCHLHVGDPTGLQASTGGNPLQVAVRAVSQFPGGGAVQGAGAIISIGSECRITGGAPAAIYGKWPWFFGGSPACSGLWPMDAGSTFLFGVRQFSAGGALAAPNSTPEHPYTFNAWAYLARPF
jgi:hypothetical protein